MFIWFLLWLAATCGAVAVGGAMLVLPSWCAVLVRRPDMLAGAPAGPLRPNAAHCQQAPFRYEMKGA